MFWKLYSMPTIALGLPSLGFFAETLTSTALSLNSSALMLIPNEKLVGIG